MCGIAGVFGRGDGDVVGAMLSALMHRGPDDGFRVVGDDFAIGSRRLSIVDLAGGRQPLANETATIWAAQNGELYNFPEVRPRLVKAGHNLHTSCDTEILPHLYEEHGPDFAAHLDGMFAVCIWDDAEKQGVLARDRMGQKPLYYHFDGESLYFASEIKALLRIPGFERRINYTALHHFLSLKHVPSPHSIFEGIEQLPPAHRLVFRPGSAPVVERYWSLDFATSESMATISEEEASEQLLALLRQGIKRRLMSDVPIGFLLSGGIDSSLSTALAAELSPNRIKTFTLTYQAVSSTPGKDADRHWAQWVAERYDTEHVEEEIDFSHFPDTIGDVLGCFDEPFAGVISTYFLSKRISQDVKVAIAGDGADELFGSYRSHRLAYPLAQWDAFRQSEDTALLRPFEDEVDYLAQIYERDDFAWRYKLLVMNDEEKSALCSPDLRAEVQASSTRSLMQGYFSKLTATDPLDRILESEYLSFFPDQVLAFVDRLSMAHSLEMRSPYLDVDFVKFSASLPGHLKIHDGITKYALKVAATKYFPQEMLFRPKEGFLMPIAHWLQDSLEDYVRDTLNPDALGKHGLFDVGTVQHLVDNLYSQEQHYTYVNKVYALVVFQEWYNRYMTTLS